MSKTPPTFLQLAKRNEELESLLRAINNNLEVIKYAGKKDGSMASHNLACEAMDWIKDHKITS